MFLAGGSENVNEKYRNAALVIVVVAVALAILVALARHASKPQQLLDAAANGDSIAVAALLQSGVSPSVRDGWQSTPLMYAASNGRTGIVSILLDRGVDIDERTRMERTALMWAAYGGHEETVALLLRRGAHTDLYDQDGLTAKDLALRGSKPSMASRIP